MSQAGDYDAYLVIERSSSSADGVGGVSHIWAPVGNFWARAVPDSGKVREQAGRITTPDSYTISIRRPVDIMGHDRIVWNGDIFTIDDFVEAPPRASEQSFHITKVLP